MLDTMAKADTMAFTDDNTAALTSFSGDELRWAAVVRKDAQADGQFFYSVATTGVYCRPSCGARLPRRENVAFHVTREAAEAAGFRPCKRCRPDSAPMAAQRAEMVARACRLIEEAEEAPTLEALATAVGISPYHFHRIFKAATGLTPKGYAAAKRANRVRDALSEGGSVTGALYEAGYGSNSRFYAAAPSILGMAPRRYSRGGVGETIRHAVVPCSLGYLLVAATDKGICAMLLGDNEFALTEDLADRFPHAVLEPGDDAFAALVEQAVAAVEAPGTAVNLPLDVRGTAFQQQVWQALRDIPAGTTMSYAELAARVGKPKAVRAVASACAANAIAVVIPCHRALRGDGSLAGYRWGLARKHALLKREGGR